MNARAETTVGDLLNGLAPPSQFDATPVDHVTQDSRQARGGSVFIARCGQNFDGTAFVDDAMSRGAALSLIDSAARVEVKSHPVIEVDDLQAKLGLIAKRAFGDVTAELTTFGITGTNGKTSVAYLIARASKILGRNTCYIGTLGAGIPDEFAPTGYTTPDTFLVHEILAEAKEAGVRAAVLEVSSHSLKQSRLSGVTFEVAAFLNLSREHLDYHASVEEYLSEKIKLVAWPNLSAVVVNADSDFADEVVDAVAPDVTLWSFSDQKTGPRDLGHGTSGRRCEHEVRLVDATWTDTRSILRVVIDGEAHELITPLLGRFHSKNLLAALACLCANDVEPGAAIKALGAVERIPGRFDVLGAVPGRPRVVIDYAHTPEALAFLLESTRLVFDRPITLVFGCGGDRDQGKRSPMGSIAAAGADTIIVTNDNPRHESPEAIVEDIKKGIPDDAVYRVELDRRRAIDLALEISTEDSVVVIAGKGHEASQEISGRRLSFDDRVHALEALRSREEIQ